MRGRALSVLVVDDEPVIARAMVAALDERGHRASLAHDAVEALARPVPDVLVVDERLGAGASGLDLIAELHRRGFAPRAVLVTALPSFDVCRRALHLGASEVIQTPFQLREIVEAVEGSSDTLQRPPRPGYRRTYDAHPATVERGVRDLLGHLLRCDVAPSTRCRVGTALAEVLDNAVAHAYPAERPGPVEVLATLDERSLELLVQDRGCGFDSVGLGLEHLAQPLESGLARACALCEDLAVDGMRGGGTRVRLRFHVARTAFDDGRELDLSELDFFTPDSARAVLAALDTAGAQDVFQLSPALAVSLGRMLAGPDPRRVLQAALWS
jgi:ActR/RegA family two-component response regulator